MTISLHLMQLNNIHFFSLQYSLRPLQTQIALSLCNILCTFRLVLIFQYYLIESDGT